MEGRAVVRVVQGMCATNINMQGGGRGQAVDFVQAILPQEVQAGREAEVGDVLTPHLFL